MKTLLITENYPPRVGGSGRWFWEIYTRLSIDEYIVAAGIVPTDPAITDDVKFECKRWPLTLTDWGITSINSLREYLKLTLLLQKTIKNHNISGIHCGRALPEGLIALLAKKILGIPYLCYVHGEELPTYKSSREYRFLSQTIYSNASLIIVNSKNTMQIFTESTGFIDKVRIMHPGVNTTFFKPHEKDDKFRQKIGWNDKKIVLTVGRLQKRKGHDHVILAINEIRKNIPNIFYVIVGSGEEQHYLENLVVSENITEHVQFLGEVDDLLMLACYQQCDLFILANREVDGDFEGFGMVLVEAQGCGKPVIAGTSGGTSETMIPDETGLLIDATNPSIIAKAIVSLLEDENKMKIMGKRAVNWVSSNFDWDYLARQAKEIFKELQCKC